jgi:hypothetical protein
MWIVKAGREVEEAKAMLLASQPASQPMGRDSGFRELELPTAKRRNVTEDTASVKSKNKLDMLQGERVLNLI